MLFPKQVIAYVLNQAITKRDEAVLPGIAQKGSPAAWLQRLSVAPRVAAHVEAQDARLSQASGAASVRAVLGGSSLEFSRWHRGCAVHEAMGWLRRRRFTRESLADSKAKNAAFKFEVAIQSRLAGARTRQARKYLVRFYSDVPQGENAKLSDLELYS